MNSYKVLVASSVIMPIVLFLAVGWHDYRNALREAEQEVSRVADTLHGHALNVFETHQLVTQRVSDRIRGMTWGEIGHSKAIHAYLQRIRNDYPQVQAVWLADPSGTIRNASEPLPASPIRVADRDYFRALRENDEGTFIGHIVVGYVLKELNFNVARRREIEGGTFDGVVIVTAFPSYFTDFWNKITPSRDIAAALIRKDGTILARAPELDRNMLKLDPNSPLLRFVRQAERGNYRAVSTVDNKERLYAYRKVGNFDAYIGYGITVQGALSLWRSNLVASGSLFALAAAALLTLSLLALQRVRQEQRAVSQWQDTARGLSKQMDLRTAAEDALRRSEERFHATVAHAPTAMVMIDPTGSIVLANIEAERLCGYERGELLGQEIEVLIPERFRSKHSELRTDYFAAPVGRAMGAGQAPYAKRKDGSEYRVRIGLSPVKTNEGLFVVAAIDDVTEHIRHTEALQKLNEALERSNIELQRFAYVASHDLQTPMRTVANFAELLQSTYKDRLDERANDWIRRVVDATKQLQTLIRELLEYSRVDHQAHPFERVPLREVFDHAVSLHDASIQEAGAEVSCGELPIVMGDRAQLVQLMLNLIGNGLKYRGADPPRIHVSAECTGHEWRIAVRDNGIGIAPRHHERIFEIFERLHDQREYPGTGIGLAVCRRVVHRHGGRIWVESESGKGSIFYFTIADGTVYAL